MTVKFTEGPLLISIRLANWGEWLSWPDCPYGEGYEVTSDFPGFDCGRNEVVPVLVEEFRQEQEVILAYYYPFVGDLQTNNILLMPQGVQSHLWPNWSGIWLRQLPQRERRHPGDLPVSAAHFLLECVDNVTGSSVPQGKFEWTWKFQTINMIKKNTFYIFSLYFYFYTKIQFWNFHDTQSFQYKLNKASITVSVIKEYSLLSIIKVILVL